jgi:hypothetical protein
VSDNNGQSDMELGPQDTAPEAFLDADPLVDVDSLSYQQQQAYQRPEVFLEAYVQQGTLLEAAEIANCHPDCAYQWRKKDTFHWNERWQQALARRRELAEQKYILDQLDNPKGNYGTDVLAIAYMNRIDPEHWRRDVQVTQNIGWEVMASLKAIQDQQQGQAQLPIVNIDKPWLVERN